MLQDESDRDAAAETGTADPSFGEHMREVFANDVFGPMYRRAGLDPAEVLALVDDLKSRLSALETVVMTLRGASSHGRSFTAPVRAAAVLDAETEEDGDANGLDDVGRNQLSKVRELIVLALLDSAERPFSLNEIMAELEAYGLKPTRSAVVSQLHRLKQQDVVHVSGSGTYSLRGDKALGYLKALRRDFEAMKPKRRT